MTASRPIVELQGVSRRFVSRGPWPWSQVREVMAVKPMDLEIHPGDILGLVGQSGSGKTTLSRMILGLEAPSSGRIMMEGTRWDMLPERERQSRRVHYQYVPQDSMSALDPQQSAVEHVVETLRVLAGLGRRDALREARAILARLGLSSTAEALPRELSGGEQKRVTLARVLALRPRLVIADEPTSGLDPERREDVLRDLLGNLPVGAACVLVSHDMEAVARWCNRVAVMLDGWLIESFSTSGSHAIHPYSKLLFAPWENQLPRNILASGGCPFHLDCPSRTRHGGLVACEERAPALLPTGDPGHLLACHALQSPRRVLADRASLSESRNEKLGAQS